MTSSPNSTVGTTTDTKTDNEEDKNEYKEYYDITNAVKEKFLNLLSAKSAFNLQKAQTTEYTIKAICNKTLPKPIKLSCTTSMSSQTINGESLCWYCRSIVPGNISFVSAIWQQSAHRLKWDTQLSLHEKLKLTPTLRIVHTNTHPIAGGLITPREFLHIVRAYIPSNTSGDILMRISTSIVDKKHFPEKKGFVRGSNAMHGLVLRKIADLKQYNLPQIYLKQLPTVVDVDESAGKKDSNQNVQNVNVNGNETVVENEHILEWVEVEMIFQVDLRGWIPKMVIEKAVAGGIIASMMSLIQYLFKMHDIQCTSVVK